MKDRVARMVAEAEARIADAAIVGESLRRQSNSRALLEILALEVLLKAAQLQSTGSISRSHRYVDIWAALPPAVRERVAHEARSRFPGHANLANIEKLLCVFEWLFTKARYGYELYEHLTQDELHELGEEWAARGAPIDEADVQYFPMELGALLHGLLQFAHSAA